MHKLKRISQVSLLFWLFVLLAGCQTMDTNFSSFLKNQPQLGWGETTVLPRHHRQIEGKSRAETAVFNAMELTKKNRYVEAGLLLREVRDLQYSDSEGYRGITNALANISLKQGDLRSFRRLGAELDMSLGKPLQVPARHLSVISLSRALSGEALPLNASSKLTKFRNSYLPKSVKLN